MAPPTSVTLAQYAPILVVTVGVANHGVQNQIFGDPRLRLTFGLRIAEGVFQCRPDVLNRVTRLMKSPPWIVT